MLYLKKKVPRKPVKKEGYLGERGQKMSSQESPLTRRFCILDVLREGETRPHSLASLLKHISQEPVNATVPDKSHVVSSPFPNIRRP